MKGNTDGEILRFLRRQEEPLGSVPAESNLPPLQIRDRIKRLVRVPARDLKPNRRNWRRHSQAQADALLGLLVEIGYADALLARELPDGRLEIINGHLRAETTPDAQVPVLVLDVSELEADKLLLTLDPLAAMAESDAERLKALLATVRTDSQAVEELLRRTAGEHLWEVLHPHELNDAQVAPDRSAELRQKWGTENGQVWSIASHRLLCGDCRERDRLRRLFEAGKQVRVILTDPPYGVNYAAKNAYLNRSDRGNRIQKAIENDALPPNQLAVLFRDSLHRALAYALPGAVCYATVPSGPLLPYFIAGFEAAGLSFKHLLVWVKQHFVIGMSDYQPRHESLIYGWVENGPHYFVDDRTQTSVLEVNRPLVSDLHPTVKTSRTCSPDSREQQPTRGTHLRPFCGSG